MTTARQDLVARGESGWFHLINRCVHRAFLCGEDSVSGRSYEHRRGWIRDRLLELSSLFAIDVYAFSVMSNHYHAAVFVDVERLHGWDNEEIARRWLRLCPPPAAREDGSVQEDSPAFQGALAALLADAERLATCRERLGDMSWFMRFMNEDIARRANREDAVTGRFWEGRFKSQALLDEGAVLACMAYVDLNPIRAGLTERVEASDFTSIQQRLANAGEAPKTLSEPVRPVGLGTASTCSTLACLSVGEYVELIEWSGRILRADKQGMIPADVAPVLERLHLDPTHWRSTLTDFNRGFHRAAGHWDRLRERANALGRHWLQGLRIAHATYLPT